MSRTRFQSLSTLILFIIPLTVHAAEAVNLAGGSEFGFGIFQTRCMTCHGNRAVPAAPAPDVLRSMPPERIYEAITTGAMQVHGEGLTDDQKRRVAESIASRLLGSRDSGLASNMPNQCPRQDSAFDPGSTPSWNGWSNGPANTRYQSPEQAGLSTDDIPSLTLAWAFGFPGGASAFGQPSVVGDRVFVGTDTGFVYSLDADTGCVYWSYAPQANVRNAMTIAPISGFPGTEYAVFFGDLRGYMYALDASTGRELWQVRVDDHLSARVTATPAYYDGVLYVPVSSWEEFAARVENYPCCTFRGSVTALDSNTGEQRWKTYTVGESKPVRKNPAGTQLWAPAGNAVWNTPVVDIQRGLLIFGTGDSFTYPASDTTDAVMALELETGAVRWVNQIYANDSFLVGCNVPANRTANCPELQGPDWDIPVSLILADGFNDQQGLVVANKPGDLLALDPDTGATLWHVDQTSDNTGMIWGGATDSDSIYFGLTSGGLIKADKNTGRQHWKAELSGPGIDNGSPVTLIDGAAFIGGSNGVLHAIDTDTGKSLWQYDTARDFETVNQVDAHGGAIASAGPVIANGRLLVTSGYSVISNNTGNVLLMFKPAE